MSVNSSAVATVLAAALASTVSAGTPLNAIFSDDGTAGWTPGEARVRVLHASPDAPAVDIWINGAKTIIKLEFEELTDFLSVPPATYQVHVVPSGATEPVVIAADLPLAADTDYTVIATGELASITPVVLTGPSGAPAAGTAWVRFFHGSPDAPAVDITLPDGTVLMGDVAFQEVSDYVPVAAGTYDLQARLAGTSTVALEIDNVSVAGGGIYTAYASGLAADIGVRDELVFLPAAARAKGVGSSFFLTDVDINNAGRGTASFEFLWLPRDTDNAVPAASQTFSVAPGQVLRVEDVLGSAFGVPDGTDAVGALALVSDRSDLLVFSRTYNRAANGTYGQAMPGFAADELIPAGSKRRILYFTEDGRFRSNIGVLNGVGSPMTVKWERYTSQGVLVEAAEAELPPWGNTQINRVFRGEAPVQGGYIDVWTETEGGSFMAYGSVADEKTSDPITVFPR